MNKATAYSIYFKARQEFLSQERTQHLITKTIDRCNESINSAATSLAKGVEIDLSNIVHNDFHALKSGEQEVLAQEVANNFYDLLEHREGPVLMLRWS